MRFVGKLIRGASFRKLAGTTTAQAPPEAHASKPSSSGDDDDDDGVHSVVISIDENAEKHYADIEQVMEEVAGGAFLAKHEGRYFTVERDHTGDTKLPVSATSNSKPKYTKDEKQKLFMKQLFRISSNHITAVSRHIEGADVSILGSASTKGPSTSSPVVDTGPPEEAPSAPKVVSVVSVEEKNNSNNRKPFLSTSPTKEQLISFISFLPLVNKCSQCGLHGVDDGSTVLDIINGETASSGASTISGTAATEVGGNSLDRAFDGVADDKIDEPMLSQDSPGVLNVPITVTDLEQSSDRQNSTSTIKVESSDESECTSTMSTRHSLRSPYQ